MTETNQRKGKDHATDNSPRYNYIEPATATTGFAAPCRKI